MRFADRIKALFGIATLDDSVYDELADLLVEGDMGAAFAMETTDALKAACRKEGAKNPEDARKLLRGILSKYAITEKVRPVPGHFGVYLLLGVNGVGKTTSCAKLADWARREAGCSRIVLAAGDTFRAAAIDQIRIHGERLGVRVVSQKQGSDSAAVLWDAIDAAKAENADLVIADTAGRMHTRQDLLRELEKMDRIVAQRAEGAEYRRLLVLDATTGQNGLKQAETFNSAVKLDGVILTKYDSTAKGGMILSLAKQFGLPTLFVGTGEGYRDFAPFDPQAFLDDFLGSGS
ncbi:MAG: signal recognition particle-docking protein FtsY [Rectinemataceae bacterium]